MLVKGPLVVQFAMDLYHDRAELYLNNDSFQALFVVRFERGTERFSFVCDLWRHDDILQN